MTASDEGTPTPRTETLSQRLRGIYSVGRGDPPEFGYRQFDNMPPINFEAAERIDALERELAQARGEALEEAIKIALLTPRREQTFQGLDPAYCYAAGCNHMANDIAEAILSLKSSPACAGAPWIPVGERLPDEFVAGMHYLCWFQDNWAVLEYDPQAGWLWGDGSYMTHQEQITHWMPLPAAPNPSPDRGEQINAVEKVVQTTRDGESRSAGEQGNLQASVGTLRGVADRNAQVGDERVHAQSPAPSLAAPSTAPQVAETGSRSQDVQGPAAAVPDDPMMVLLSLTPKSDTGILRFPEWHDAIRALAAHYEAKGMRMAAEICKSVSAAESERTIGRPTSGEYQIGAEFCAAAILAAATKQEADRGRR